MDAIAHGEEVVARMWEELPVRVDWATVPAQCAYAWAQARAFVVVPAIRLLLVLSLAMTVMILLEKLFVAAVYFTVKAFGLKPERRYRWRPITAAAAGDGDEEACLEGGGGGGGAGFPVVLVQIPMYNEREVYKLSIGAACALEWPSDRLVIQVLDDSTDPVVKLIFNGYSPNKHTLRGQNWCGNPAWRPGACARPGSGGEGQRLVRRGASANLG